MKIAVLGNGAWGVALARVLIDNGNDVMLWGIEQVLTDDINNNHRLTRYFGNDVELPTGMKSTTDLKEALKGAETVLFTVPTFAMHDVAKEVNELLEDRVHIITGAKGFELQTHKRMSQVLRDSIDVSKRYDIVSLIGPSHAEEVVKGEVTLITATSLNLDEATFAQNLFSNKYFRVYTNDDEVGAEYASAIKNSIAIASGVMKGLKLGDNARAALITRGIAEIKRFGMKMGGRSETFSGLTGIGDLVVTCYSQYSRNFQAGYAIGLADSAKEFLRTNKTTVEGINTAKVITEMAKELDIDMPICQAVYEVINNNRRPSEMIDMLMNRKLKTEKEV